MKSALVLASVLGCAQSKTVYHLFDSEVMSDGSSTTVTFDQSSLSGYTEMTALTVKASAKNVDPFSTIDPITITMGGEQLNCQDSGLSIILCGATLTAGNGIGSTGSIDVSLGGGGMYEFDVVPSFTYDDGELVPTPPPTLRGGDGDGGGGPTPPTPTPSGFTFPPITPVTYPEFTFEPSKLILEKSKNYKFNFNVGIKYVNTFELFAKSVDGSCRPQVSVEFEEQHYNRKEAKKGCIYTVDRECQLTWSYWDLNIESAYQKKTVGKSNFIEIENDGECTLEITAVKMTYKSDGSSPAVPPPTTPALPTTPAPPVITTANLETSKTITLAKSKNYKFSYSVDLQYVNGLMLHAKSKDGSCRPKISVEYETTVNGKKEAEEKCLLSTDKECVLEWSYFDLNVNAANQKKAVGKSNFIEIENDGNCTVEVTQVKMTYLPAATSTVDDKTSSLAAGLVVLIIFLVLCCFIGAGVLAFCMIRKNNSKSIIMEGTETQLQSSSYDDAPQVMLEPEQHSQPVC